MGGRGPACGLPLESHSQDSPANGHPDVTAQGGSTISLMTVTCSGACNLTAEDHTLCYTDIKV